MKVYSCSNCNNLIYFENSFCLKCKFPLGFDANSLSMVTLKTGTNNRFSDNKDQKRIFKYCHNAQFGTCNWLIPANDESDFCIACGLNRLIPDLSSPDNLTRWTKIEAAKHRLVYSLLRLHLPVEIKTGEEEKGIAFDFLTEFSPDQKILTGHDNGTITLNTDEADDAERVRHKEDLGERYRTLLGHFRHEIGHYYWDVLIRDTKNIDGYRALFGDERRDYTEALQQHYKNGAPANWSDNYISAYATSHSWEDWAETWAHYLHLMDTLETAFAFGIKVQPGIKASPKGIDAVIREDPYKISDFKKIFDWWLPLSFSVNSLNRSMGYSDFYPFVIPEPVFKKLKFIHDLCINNLRK